MKNLFRCCVLAALLPLSACLTKMIDKDYSPPTQTPLAQVRFLPVERGGYSIEILRDKRWLRLQGQVGEKRKLAGIGDDGFFNEFGTLQTEIPAGAPVTMALSHVGSVAGTPGCRVELKLCAAVGERYEVVLTPGAAACEAYVQKQVVSEGGVLRREKLSAEDALRCVEPSQP